MKKEVTFIIIIIIFNLFLYLFFIFVKFYFAVYRNNKDGIKGHTIDFK
jgi:hypothetical protein